VAALERARSLRRTARWQARGRDLFTDEPIEGGDSKIGQFKTSPLLSTQSGGTRAIRGFAATATIDQSRGAYIARLHKHVVDTVRAHEGPSGAPGPAVARPLWLTAPQPFRAPPGPGSFGGTQRMEEGSVARFYVPRAALCEDYVH
jgi:hypothetical protein